MGRMGTEITHIGMGVIVKHFGNTGMGVIVGNVSNQQQQIQLQIAKHIFRSSPTVSLTIF